jgi:nucleoside phosphorylase
MRNIYHLAICKNLVSDAQWLITCGDPKRTDKIAAHLDDSELIGDNREYRTGMGTLQGTKVAVISHGIGGPGLSIMLDEAFKIMPGLKGVIRVGTSGGLSKEASAGKVAISEGAVRLDGASSQIIPDPEYPAVPDIKEEMKMGVPWYEGKYYIVALKDHVNLGFSLKGLSKKEKELFEGGGKTMKHIEINSLNEIDEKKIVKLFKLVKS